MVQTSVVLVAHRTAMLWLCAASTRTPPPTENVVWTYAAAGVCYLVGSLLLQYSDTDQSLGGWCGTADVHCIGPNKFTPCQQGYGSCEIIRPKTCGEGSGTTGGRTVGYYLASNVRDRLCNRISPSQSKLYHAVKIRVRLDYANTRD